MLRLAIRAKKMKRIVLAVSSFFAGERGRLETIVSDNTDLLRRGFFARSLEGERGRRSCASDACPDTVWTQIQLQHFSSGMVIATRFIARGVHAPASRLRLLYPN